MTAVPRLSLFLGAALALVFVGLLNAVPVASNDLWLQIKVGQLTLSDHAIPRTLLFPFTAARDAPFQAHEWLPSLLFFALQRAVGDAGLQGVQGLLALVQFALSFRLAYRLSRSAGVALLLAALAMLAVNFRYVLRPEAFALLFLVLLLGVLMAGRDGGRRAVLGWTLPIGLLWANCHGSFLLGPALAGLVGVGEAATAAIAARAPARLAPAWRAGWPYAVAALGMVLASLVNPRGVELLSFAFRLQASDAIRSLIKEWLPTLHPLFVADPAFRVFAATGLSALGLLLARRRHVGATHVLLFVTFAVLALLRNRHIVWFAFVAMTVCADVVGRGGITARAERRVRAAVVLLALAGSAACTRFGNVRGAFVFESPSNNFTPVMVAELARPDLTGNVYNSYELGSELIYRDWPRLRPSIDSRVDSYGDAYFLAHQRLLVDEASLRLFLDAWHVNHMLLLRRDFDHDVRGMPRIAGEWHVRLADAKMLLLERNTPFTAPGR